MFRNKLLKRYFKKYLGFADRTDVITSIQEMTVLLKDQPNTAAIQGFLANFDEFLLELEEGILNLETIIAIRDRSLAISSEELTELANKIQTQSEEQQKVLAKLNEVVKNTDQNADLMSLVTAVEALVKSQFENAKMLELIFVESHSISRSLTYTDLAQRVEKTLRTLSGRNIDCKMFFNESIFEQQGHQFFKLAANDKIDNASPLAEKPTNDYIFIDNPKGTGSLAILEIDWLESLGKEVTHRYLSYFKSMSSVIGNTVANIKYLETEKKRQYLESELLTARLVQNTLLPPPKDFLLSNLNICGFYKSASECGGDWWNFVEIGDGKVIVFVGDVTGHGTASAMLSAVVRGFCDSLTYRKTTDPAVILHELNELVYSVSKSSERMMTMFCMIVDTKNKTLEYANAGHNNPLLLSDRATKKVSYLPGAGSTLGFKPSSSYDKHSIDFASGDTLFIYSDGLVECENKEEEFYGDSRLRRTLGKVEKMDKASDWIRLVQKDMDVFRSNAELQDDVTMVAVKLL